jgi:hypothetical protein
MSENSRSKKIIQTKAKNYVGKTFKVNCGWVGEVLEYKGSSDLTVRWQDGSVEDKIYSANLKSGSHRPKMFPGVVGVGIFDKRGQEYCKDIYWKWSSMIKRCYCEHYLKDKPTYRGVTVSEEWKVFSNFSKWAEQFGDIKSLELDKDFLGDGTHYSEETCCFIPSYINSLDIHNIYGSKGVTYNKRLDKWEASVSNTQYCGRRENKYIGVYFDKEDAHLAYIRAKKNVVLERLDWYRKEDFYDSRVEGTILRSKLFTDYQ